MLALSTDFDAVCPVIGSEVTCNAVATDCSNVALFTCGPIGFNERGNSMELNSEPSMSQALSPCKMRRIPKNVNWMNELLNIYSFALFTSNRFSQNNCFGFSCFPPAFRSDLDLLSWLRCNVTGCLKIDAVCRIGGTSETSVRTPRLWNNDTFCFFFINTVPVV